MFIFLSFERVINIYFDLNKNNVLLYMRLKCITPFQFQMILAQKFSCTSSAVLPFFHILWSTLRKMFLKNHFEIKGTKGRAIYTWKNKLIVIFTWSTLINFITFLSKRYKKQYRLKLMFTC